MSEQQFIRSTAPTLAGLKTGSLFPYRYAAKADAIRELRRYNQRLRPKGLRLLPLRMTEGFALLYLYRPGRLRRDLQQEEAAKLLRKAGYPDCDEAGCLRELCRRLAGCESFPHEIGLFLSYPPEDVIGFLEHREAGCKCTGFWKVYGDAEAAQKTFAQYKKCIVAYYRAWKNGRTLERLTVPGDRWGRKEERA